MSGEPLTTNGRTEGMSAKALTTNERTNGQTNERTELCTSCIVLYDGRLYCKENSDMLKLQLSW